MGNFLGKASNLLKNNGREVAYFVTALLLSVSIWLIICLSQNYTEMVSVPVVARSNIEGRARNSVNSANVVARCRARGFELIRLGRTSESNPVEVEFAPEDIQHRSGDIFYITGSTLNKYVNQVFGNVSGLESLVTDTLSFRFPEESHKKVPVQSLIKISYRDQYTGVGSMRIKPDSVTVYGEPYRLENIDKVYTRSLTLSDLSESADGEVVIEPVKGIRLSSEKAEYHMDVVRYVEISSDLPVRSRNVPSNVRLIIYPNTVKAYFRCVFPVAMEPEKYVRFYIDYKDFAESIDGKCIPRTDALPEGIIDYKLEPEVFECVESSR